MRLEITKKTDDVLRAICSLAGHEGRQNALGIAEDTRTSRQMVPKLMEPLIRKGWVISTPGPTGGYELVVDLDEVSVLQLIEAVEGEVEDGRCVLRGTPCPALEVCAIHEAWFPAREALLSRLASTMVGSLQQSGVVCRPEPQLVRTIGQDQAG